MQLTPCECEHSCHFHDTGKLSPNGNPGHRYGQPFAESYIVRVRTDGQTERVCKDCANDCRVHGERL